MCVAVTGTKLDLKASVVTAFDEGGPVVEGLIARGPTSPKFSTLKPPSVAIEAALCCCLFSKGPCSIVS